MKNVLILSLLLIVFVNCRYDSTYFDLYNNSGKPICYYMSLESGFFYPDTTLPKKDPNPYKFNKEWGFSREGDIFANFPTDTLSIFFFDPDTLTTYDWETIRDEYKILVRYDLSHNDLNRLDWKITYPPTETMKDMKMYPLYREEN
jgi:hypothetical protein